MSKPNLQSRLERIARAPRRKNIPDATGRTLSQTPSLPRSGGEGRGEEALKKTNDRKATALVSTLLPWFAQNARDLPWRRTRDPYAIWVSEIMLQQTQVKTVIPYWERWMRALPAIADLAAASSETLHKLWEGLGYYTRVRNLQKAAQQILTHHAGQFPRDPQAILDLSGIGRYTAGAIASIAFNQAQPILDGNVIRVLTRLYGITQNPREKTTNELLWTIAHQLVQTATSPTLNIKPETLNSASHLNQSLMELGALICTPRQPKCPQCPVNKHCNARRTQRQHQIPNLAKRPAATQRHFIAYVIEHQGRFLARQRPAGQVNAHLWEFPNLETTHLDLQPDKTLAAHLGLRLKNLRQLCTLRHTITRYRITLQVFQADVSTLSPQPPTPQWLTIQQLHTLPFTSAHRKILNLLPSPPTPPRRTKKIIL